MANSGFEGQVLGVRQVGARWSWVTEVTCLLRAQRLLSSVTGCPAGSRVPQASRFPRMNPKTRVFMGNLWEEMRGKQYCGVGGQRWGGWGRPERGGQEGLAEAPGLGPGGRQEQLGRPRADWGGRWPRGTSPEVAAGHLAGRWAGRALRVVSEPSVASTECWVSVRAGAHRGDGDHRECPVLFAREVVVRPPPEPVVPTAARRGRVGSRTRCGGSTRRHACPLGSHGPLCLSFPGPGPPRALLSGCLRQRGDSSEFGGTWPVVPIVYLSEGTGGCHPL